MVFNLLLVPFLGYVGLALATAMSATLNAGLLYRGLKGRDIYHFTADTWWFFGKLIVAALFMAALLWFVTPAIELWYEFSVGQKLVWLFACIGAGAITYVTSLLILGVRPRDLKSS